MLAAIKHPNVLNIFDVGLPRSETSQGHRTERSCSLGATMR